MTLDRSDKNSGGGTAIQTETFADLKAIAFDLDNTLCHYTFSVEEVFAEALRRAAIAPGCLGELSEAAARYAELWSEVQTLYASTERIRLHILERLLDERGVADPSTAARLSDAYGIVREETGVRPFDGAFDLLSDLKTRYRLGLLTNGPSDIQWEKIHALGLGDAFDAIVVAGDLGIYKPDGRVFEILLERLATRESESLFVGDNHAMDIVGAHRVGMRTAWVRQNGAEPSEPIAPDLEIFDVNELRGVLL